MTCCEFLCIVDLTRVDLVYIPRGDIKVIDQQAETTPAVSLQLNFSTVHRVFAFHPQCRP
jgi:hypothetical protein